MKMRQISSGIVLAAIAGLGGAAVSTTGADEHRGNPPKPAYHAPAPPHGHHEKEEEAKLNQILANQRLLLDRLGELNDSTLPNSIAKLGPALDGLTANMGLLLEQIGGLQAQCSLADLLPVPKPGFSPPTSYCRFAPNGQLIVQVLNQGGVAAPGFTTRVTFLSSPGAPMSEVSSSGLAAFNGFTDVLFTIPDSCYPGLGESQCSFLIEVDSGNAVGESDEANNKVAGACVRVG